MKNAFLALLVAIFASFSGASYLVELTYSNGLVTQTGVYYTNAEASSPGGNFSYSIAGATGGLDFPEIVMHDANNSQGEVSGYQFMTKKTESTAYIVVPDSAISSSGTAENLKVLNGTQVLLDEPLKTPTRLVPSAVSQASQTTGSSTATTTPGTVSNKDDGAGFDLFIGLILGAIAIVAVLVFLKKKAKK